jgi:protein-tyrosine-phosphatase/DNA-binding transcriptional ArsR family regulator
MAVSSRAAPAFVRLASHPLRWLLMTALATSDLRVRELVALAGEPQNLVSYHLRLLRDAGLVTAARSTFDGRDSYYHLDLDRCARELAHTGAALHASLGPTPQGTPSPAGSATVLFVCTGNSARSPIAQALLRRRGIVHVESAGTLPRPRLHPRAARVLRDRYGIDISRQRPRDLSSLNRRRFDYLITLCDKAREVVPALVDHAHRIHWSISDPAANSAADQTDDDPFGRTAAEIETRIRHLLPVLQTGIHQEALP